MSKRLDDRRRLERVDRLCARVAADPQVRALLKDLAETYLLPPMRAQGVDPLGHAGVEWLLACHSALRSAVLLGIHGYVAARWEVPLGDLVMALDAAGLLRPHVDAAHGGGPEMAAQIVQITDEFFEEMAAHTAAQPPRGSDD